MHGPTSDLLAIKKNLIPNYCLDIFISFSFFITRQIRHVPARGEFTGEASRIFDFVPQEQLYTRRELTSPGCLFDERRPCGASRWP